MEDIKKTCYIDYMEAPISPEQQQKPNLFRKIFNRIVPLSTKAPKTPASINTKPPTFESIAPVITDRSILASTDSSDDPTLLRFLTIMSKVSKEMDTAWRGWVSAGADQKALQEFGRLATKDTTYQHELHQLILDRLGANLITIYHAIPVGGKPLGNRVGFMTGTTSRQVAEHYAKKYGGVDIEEIMIQPDDIKAIGSISESEVVFISRQAIPLLKT